MNDNNKLKEGSRIISILDKPSSKSFGMCPLLIKCNEDEYYIVTGLSDGSRIKVSEKEFNMYAGHLLEVDSLLSSDFTNPVALWLGREFYTEAERLRAQGLVVPNLPEIGEQWYQPSTPNSNRGWYSVKEVQNAYRSLEDFVDNMAPEAIAQNNPDLAKMMAWTLPQSAKTLAALYFTAPNNKRKRNELLWQLKIRKDTGKPITAEELIQEHEQIKLDLLIQ